MTTIPVEVKNIRRLLQDEPVSDVLAASIAASGTTTMTVTDVNKHAIGSWWEFDDDTGDKVLETNVDTSTSIITIRRSYRGATPTAHSNAATLVREPRFEYDNVSQAIGTILDIDLYAEGIFDLQEHQVTSSDTTNYYDSPAAGCLEFKDVYQLTGAMTGPGRDSIWFSPKPRNVDTSLFSSGKYFQISGNYGIPGSDVYYVSCAHKHTITTLTEGATRILDFLSAAYVLEWTEIKRSAGPNNQGDITVRPGASLPTAAYFRQLAEEQIQKERRTVQDLIPATKRFVRTSSWL